MRLTCLSLRIGGQETVPQYLTAHSLYRGSTLKIVNILNCKILTYRENKAMSLLLNTKIMKRLFHIMILFTLVINSGCSEDEQIEDASSIYLQEFSLENLYFTDTTLTYDFNGDNWDDFSMELSWIFDTSDYDYTMEGNQMMFFEYYDEIKCGMSDFIEWESQRMWQLGDTVIDSYSFRSWTIRSSGYFYNTNDIDTFQTYISGLKNDDVYWAYYLESGNKIHFGWIRLNCGLFAEIAYNLIPEEPIIIGQRY